MKTAVEWLQQQVILETNLPLNLENVLVFNKLIEQAKEMEKEQVIEAHFHGCERGEMFNNENRAFITDSEQYYNETFKQQEQ
jgi:hypothetical protein